MTPPFSDGAPADDHGWRALALAVVLRAVLDARKGDAAALGWLTGNAGRAWVELLDLPHWPPPGFGTTKTNGAETQTESGGRALVGRPAEGGSRPT